MRRIPRQIRLDPAFDQQVRAVITANGEKQTITDVIHKALAHYFRSDDSPLTLQRVADDLHQEMHNNKVSTVDAIRAQTAMLERIETARLRDQSTVKMEIADLKRQLTEMAETLGRIEQRPVKRGLF